jgi:hypothetical protein
MTKNDVLGEALAEMQAARRPGVVITIPDDRHYLLDSVSRPLEDLFDRGGPLVERAVFACTRASAVQARFGEAPTLLALDPDGRPVGSRQGALQTLLQPGPFAKAVEELLAGHPSTAPARRALPYGVEWAEDTHRTLFGSRYDPCPECGRPGLNPRAAKLIRYLRLTE